MCCCHQIYHTVHAAPVIIDGWRERCVDCLSRVKQPATMAVAVHWTLDTSDTCLHINVCSSLDAPKQKSFRHDQFLAPPSYWVGQHWERDSVGGRDVAWPSPVIIGELWYDRGRSLSRSFQTCGNPEQKAKLPVGTKWVPLIHLLGHKKQLCYYQLLEKVTHFPLLCPPVLPFCSRLLSRNIHNLRAQSLAMHLVFLSFLCHWLKHHEIFVRSRPL